MKEEKPIQISEILQMIKTYWSLAWRNKGWVVVGSIVLAGLLVTQAWLTPKKYSAPLTFVINEDDGGSGGGIGAVLGELGFGGSKAGHNYEKISQLATSRLILGKAMTSLATVNGKTDFLGNHLVDILEIPLTSKNGNIDLTGFRFQPSRDSLYEPQQDLAILLLSKKIKGDPKDGTEGLLSIDYDDESSFLKIVGKTEYPELSIALANTLYDVLSEFYIHNTIEKQQATYDHVANKADSIYGELRSAEMQLARFQDQGKSIILSTNKLPKQQLARKVEMLYIMYGESIKNQERAEFLLNSATPYFQVIDRPLGPFQPTGKSRMKALIIGGILGGLLAIGLIIGRHWLMERLEAERLGG
ncbi:MAG: hypothetical protein ACI86C_001904 [Candidatus Latescibacterota bacterium]|jgi:uncharacterized protein involved in exopolysaccharide biosynthesis